MAKLPSKDDLGSLPDVRPVRSIARADLSAADQGMAQLGNTVAKLGDHLYAADLAAKEFDTERRFQEFKWQEQQNLDKQMREVEPGQAEGFPDRWAGDYQERAKGFMANVPEPLKPKVDKLLFDTERELYGAGAQFARHEQKRSSVNALDDLKNKLALSPDLGQARASYDETLKANPYLSPIEKDEVRRKQLDDLEHQNVEARIGRGEDLGDILRDLQQPGAARKEPSGVAGGDALEFIKGQEGFTPKAKWDYAQHSNGYGTKANGPGEVITREEAQKRLEAETGKVQDWIDGNVTVPLNAKQKTALTSFGFNLGTGRGGLSDLKEDINAGNWDRVADRMQTFNRAGGRVDNGLVGRRRREADLLIQGAKDGPDSTSGQAALPDAQQPTAQQDATGSSEGAQLPADTEGTKLPAAETAGTGKYIHLDPKRRAALIFKAQIAGRDIAKTELKDAVAEAARTGTVPVDDGGRTALDRNAAFLTTNQRSTARRVLDETVMGFKASAPLPNMTDEQAQTHLDNLAPPERAQQGEGYAAAAKVYDKAWKDWRRIKELRSSDPVAAISGGTIKGAAPPSIIMGEDGRMTVRQGDETDLRLRPAPEVSQALDRIKAAQESQNTPAGVNGKLFTTLRTDPIAAREMLIEARLDAQHRLSIADPKVISREEADDLLKMPKTAFKDLQSKAYMDGLKTASDRFYQVYGPKYAKRAFEDAISFHLSKSQDVSEANTVMARLLAKQATAGISPADLAEARQGLERVRNLEEIDRVGRLFAGQGQFSPGAFQGDVTALPYGRANTNAAGEPVTIAGRQGRFSTFSTPLTDQLQETTGYAAREADRPVPSPEDVAWALAKPSRQEAFDQRFGNGAYAREMVKRQSAR